MTGRLIHTGQAVVDLVMRVSALPEPGGDVYADSSHTYVGGAFNTLLAAVRSDAQCVYAGGHGTGPNGERVREALKAAGVLIHNEAVPTLDTGFSVALVDATGERSFVSYRGAETARPQLPQLQVTAADIVVISGYSLLEPETAKPLVTWLAQLPQVKAVVFDPSPLIDTVDHELLKQVLECATHISTNEREAVILRDKITQLWPERTRHVNAIAAGILASDVRSTPENEEAVALATNLALYSDANIVLRRSEQGCVAVEMVDGALAERQVVQTLDIVAIDTNGAGDAHLGVLCANLLQGSDLVTAVRRGTIAASISVTREGPATCPTAAEIDKHLPQ